MQMQTQQRTDGIVYSREIVYFDGHCSLCAFAVRFILRHERTYDMVFASLQSEHGTRVMQRLNMHSATPDTLVYEQGDQLYTGSEAALLIATKLRAPWRWLGVFRVLPLRWRDALYYWVARHRYQWFGKTDVCALPSSDQRHRFL